jgi:hypothetical protein
MRAVRLTVCPTTPYLLRCSEPMLPATTTSGVQADADGDRGQPLCAVARVDAVHRGLHRERAARGAPCVIFVLTGAPNIARMPSPMNSSTVPLCAMITADIAPR